MFSSFFSTAPPVDPTASTLDPVSSRYKPDQLFGELIPKDLEWTCAGGFITETQSFYILAEDGTVVILQVIHSSIGLWYPTIQFTAKIYDPKTKEITWKSVNVANFVTPPPNLDKRSSKADKFTLTFKSNPGSDHPESYSLTANPADDLQLSFDFLRPAGIPGFKIGNDEQGGFTYYGPDPKNAEGYMVHRFWPHVVAKGTIIKNGQLVTLNGPGMFVHAIQGMRPNLLASSWNFANFQSEEHGGVAAIMMEFKTLETHGRHGAGSGGVKVNVGSLVVGGKLASVTAETTWPDEAPFEAAPILSRATHLNPEVDPETAYNVPSQITYKWAGPSLLKDLPGTFYADAAIDVGPVQQPNGLVEKVDVLAEIPYVIKVAVNYVAGTKPYVYQWINPSILSVKKPDGETLEVKGKMYNEATFIC